MTNPMQLFHSGSAPLSLSAIIGGLAVVFSTALSGSGIYFSLETTSLHDVARFAIAALSTLFITLLAFRFWMIAGKLTRERAQRHAQPALPATRHPAPFIAGAVVMMAASVITAMIAMVFLNHRDAVQSLLNRQTFSGTLAPVNDLAANLNGIAVMASQVEQIAAERSSIETAYGGTCDNAPAGFGPRAALRADHAGAARDISDRADALSLDASLIVQNMISATDQARIEDLFSQAKQLSFDRSRIEIAAKAEQLARGYAGSGFLVDGRQIYCPDVELATLFAQIAEQASQDVDLPTEAPTRQDATIFDAFGVVLPALLTGELGREVGLTRATLLPFLLFAGLVDAVSMAGALSFGASRAVRITPSELEQIHRTAWVLRNFFKVWPFLGSEGQTDPQKVNDGQAFVYVPLGGSPERTHQAEYLVALLGLDVDPAYQFVPLLARRSEFRDWVNQMKLAGGGATHYAQYPIRDQATLDRIKRMKREALMALGMRKLDTTNFPEFGQEPKDKVVTLKAV
tara:strand:+ start:2005 stop:3552 length:1548 start_codon:yes stop_codon:yes gene_type:complete